MIEIILIVKITLKRNKHQRITAWNKTDFLIHGGSRANQATLYDIENTSLLKPSNIIQIQQQDTK